MFDETNPEKEKEMEGDMKHMVGTHYQGLMEAFRNFDADQSGYVSVYDFRRTAYLHLGVTMAHADHLFKSIGYAENGFINYLSWMAKCVQLDTTEESVCDLSMHYQAGNPSLDPALMGEQIEALQPRIKSMRTQLLSEPAIQKRGEVIPFI